MDAAHDLHAPQQRHGNADRHADGERDAARADALPPPPDHEPHVTEKVRRVIDGRIELLTPTRFAERQPRHLAVDAVGNGGKPEEERAGDDRLVRCLRDQPGAARADEKGQRGRGVGRHPELQQRVAEHAADAAVEMPSKPAVGRLSRRAQQLPGGSSPRLTGGHVERCAGRQHQRRSSSVIRRRTCLFPQDRAANAVPHQHRGAEGGRKRLEQRRRDRDAGGDDERRQAILVGIGDRARRQPIGANGAHAIVGGASRHARISLGDREAEKSRTAVFGNEPKGGNARRSRAHNVWRRARCTRSIRMAAMAGYCVAMYGVSFPSTDSSSRCARPRL